MTPAAFYLFALLVGYLIGLLVRLHFVERPLSALWQRTTQRSHPTPIREFSAKETLDGVDITELLKQCKQEKP